MSAGEAREAARRAEARAALDGAARDGEVIGDLSLARRMRDGGARLGSHFAGADADPDDAVEIWGRRIGRGLALVAAVVMIGQLTRMLGMW